jgi:ribosome-binding ATPase YchF (GTP1/OBG family)
VKQIINAAYEELELCHFYTVGKDEVRAWAIRTG